MQQPKGWSECESDLRRAIAAQPHVLQHAIVSTATWTQGARKGACGRIQLVSECPAEGDARAHYPQVMLERRVLSGPDLAGLVIQMLREQSDKEPTAHWQRTDGDHRDGPRTWPVDELVVSGLAEQVDHSSSGTVIGYGLPPHANLSVAIAKWFGVGDTYSGAWRVSLTDRRAYIAGADFHGDGRVEINVESAVGDLEIHVVFGTAQKQEVASALERASSSTTFLAPSDADRAAVYVVASDHSVLDRCSLYRAPREPEAITEQTLVERCTRDLHDGEHEQVEIKPWIGPGNEKEIEILRTIVAFANTSGGRLYIGVGDDGVPLDRGKLFKRFPDSAREKGEPVEDAVRRWLRKLVQEGLLRRPSFSDHFVELPRGRVFCVDVEAGPDRPYATKENDIFIRRGANNRRPDADRISLDPPAGAARDFTF